MLNVKLDRRDPTDLFHRLQDSSLIVRHHDAEEFGIRSYCPPHILGIAGHDDFAIARDQDDGRVDRIGRRRDAKELAASPSEDIVDHDNFDARQ